MFILTAAKTPPFRAGIERAEGEALLNAANEREGSAAATVRSAAATVR